MFLGNEGIVSSARLIDAGEKLKAVLEKLPRGPEDPAPRIDQPALPDVDTSDEALERAAIRLVRMRCMIADSGLRLKSLDSAVAEIHSDVGVLLTLWDDVAPPPAWRTRPDSWWLAPTASHSDRQRRRR